MSDEHEHYLLEVIEERVVVLIEQTKNKDYLNEMIDRSTFTVFVAAEESCWLFTGCAVAGRVPWYW